MAGARSPSYSGGWGRRMVWTWEVGVAMSRDRATTLQPGWQSEKKQKNQGTQATNSMMNAIVPHISILTFNVNGLNALLKRYRTTEWIRTHQPTICCLQETHLTHKTHINLKGWKKAFHANGHQKQAGVVILVSDKTNFKATAVKRDKEGHYIMGKGLVQQENIIILNIYAPNSGAPKCIKQYY